MMEKGGYMRKLGALVSILCGIIIYIDALGVPAYPKWKKFRQPDGTVFIGRLRGDEHYHWLETKGRYMAVLNKDGWWVYAKKVNGLFEPTEYRVAKDAPPEFSRDIYPDEEAIKALPDNKYKVINARDMWEKYKIKPKWNLQEDKLLVILGEYTDTTFFAGPPAHDSAFYYKIYLSTDAHSCRDFYRHISRGKHDLTGAVRGPYNVGGAYTDYSNAGTGDSRELDFATDLADAADPYVNYDLYDGDGNGYVDHYIALSAGYECAYTGDDQNDLWACSYPTATITTNEADIHGPQIISESGTDDQGVKAHWTYLHMGVMAHELYHSHGASDAYDYGYQQQPVGIWSLMDAGAWNENVDGATDSTFADRPTLPLAVQIWDIGWFGDVAPWGTYTGWLTNAHVDTCNVNGRYVIFALDSIAFGDSVSGPCIYFVQSSDFAANVSDEWYVIENRQRAGWYEGTLPASGLLIAHFDSSITLNGRPNDGPPENDYFMYWIEQVDFDEHWHYDNPNDTFYRDDWRCPYAADYNRCKIDTSTYGHTWSSDGNYAGPRIWAISDAGYRMEFCVGDVSVPSDPAIGYWDIKVHDYPNGDNNGVADARETIKLYITLRNEGGAATAVQCSLWTGDPYVSVLYGGPCTWGDIGSGAEVTNPATDSFVLYISPDVPKNYCARLRMLVTATNPWQDTIIIPLNISDYWVTEVKSWSNRQVNEIAIWQDTIYLALAGLDFGGKGILRFTRDWTYIDSFGYPHQASGWYIEGMDFDNSGYLWVKERDSLYKLNRTNGTVLYKTRLERSDWAGADGYMKRLRGICFAPSYSRVKLPNGAYDRDSIYAVWQVYGDPSIGYTDTTYVESIMLYRRNGTIAYRKPLLDGHSNQDAQGRGRWNNWRLCEHDGFMLYTNCLYLNLIQQRRINWSGEHHATWKEFESAGAGSNYSCYGGELWTNLPNGPYNPGGSFLLYQCDLGGEASGGGGIMPSHVYVQDVRSFILPDAPQMSAEEYNDGVDPDPDSVVITWTPVNDSIHKDSFYIIYRSTDSLFYPNGSNAIDTVYWSGTYGDQYRYVDYPPPAKATYYYAVNAVNYYGWSAGAPVAPNVSTTPVGKKEQTGRIFALYRPMPSPFCDATTCLLYTSPSPRD